MLADGSAIISAIASGFVMSAAEYDTSTPNSSEIFCLILSIADPVPRPFSTTVEPACVKALAMPSPMPLVDPVTSDILPVSGLTAEAAASLFQWMFKGLLLCMRSKYQAMFLAVERLPPPLPQIVVHDLAEPERQVRDDVGGR